MLVSNSNLIMYTPNDIHLKNWELDQVGEGKELAGMSVIEFGRIDSPANVSKTGYGQLLRMFTG